MMRIRRRRRSKRAVPLVAYAGFGRVPVELCPAPPYDAVDLDAVEPFSSPIGPERGNAVIVAGSAADLRRTAAVAGLLPKAARITVIIEDAPLTGPPPVPRPGTLWPRILHLEVCGHDRSGWLFRVRLAKPHPAGDVVSAVVQSLSGGRPVAAAPWPRAGLSGPGAALWRPGDRAAVGVPPDGPSSDRLGLPVADLVVRCGDEPGGPWSDHTVPLVDRLRHDPASGRPDHVPPIDEGMTNPAGFVIDPRLGPGELRRLNSGDWAVTLGKDVVARFPSTGCVSDADVARMRDLQEVAVSWGTGEQCVSVIRIIAGLAAAGVPVVAVHVPAWARRLLGGELAALLEAGPRAELTDTLRREEHSVRLRRCALRTHGTRARWQRLTTSAGLAPAVQARVSVVLCTRRPEMIPFCLGQVARQRLVDFEVILVQHGFPGLPRAAADAIGDFDRPLTVIDVPADVPFGAALNRAAARASGTHLAKMDDDDWYGPEHLADMMLAASYSAADLVGCGAEYVYIEEIDLTVRRLFESERPSRYVAGGTIVVDRGAFLEVGGFRPIPRSVDAYLLQALLSGGGTVYQTHGLGYLLRRRPTGHTWTENIGYFLRGASGQWRGFRPSSLLEAPDEHIFVPAGRNLSGGGSDA